MEIFLIVLTSVSGVGTVIMLFTPRIKYARIVGILLGVVLLGSLAPLFVDILQTEREASLPTSEGHAQIPGFIITWDLIGRSVDDRLQVSITLESKEEAVPKDIFDSSSSCYAELDHGRKIPLKASKGIPEETFSSIILVLESRVALPKESKGKVRCSGFSSGVDFHVDQIPLLPSDFANLSG